MIHGFAADAHLHPTWEAFGPLDWVVAVLAGAVAVWAIWKAVLYTLRPGETEPDHIKRSILTEPGALEVHLGSSGTRRAQDDGGPGDA